jgi:hypothetical protein
MRKTLGAFALGLVFTAAASFAEPAPVSPAPEVLLAGIFATAVQTEAPFQAPAPVPLACGPYCDCPGCYTTATASGTGSSCTNAQSSLTAQLRDLANGVCGVACQLTITYTQACTLIAPGTYQVAGYARHGCRDSTC